MVFGTDFEYHSRSGIATGIWQAAFLPPLKVWRAYVASVETSVQICAFMGTLADARSHGSILWGLLINNKVVNPQRPKDSVV